MSEWRDCTASLFDGGFLCLLLVLVLIASLGCASTQRACEVPRELVARDDDRDGVVEARIMLYEYEGIFIGTMIHVCCTDALTHLVEFYIHRESLLGLPVLSMRWTVDNEKTHQNRLKKFGPGYWHPRAPDDWMERQDPWGAENQPQ